MMGLSRTVFWTSHFLHYFTMFAISVGLVTFSFCFPFSENGAVLNYTHWSVFYVFLLLYGISLINMGFMICTWFSTATSTSAAVPIIIFIFYVPYGFITQDLDGIQFMTKMELSILSPVAMGLGCSVVSSWESRAIGND
jgi:hypothetical protein